jgi:hypothetical protein
MRRQASSEFAAPARAKVTYMPPFGFAGRMMLFAPANAA